MKLIENLRISLKIPRHGKTEHKKNYLKIRNCYICQDRTRCKFCPPQSVMIEANLIFDIFFKIINLARKDLKENLEKEQSELLIKFIIERTDLKKGIRDDDVSFDEN